MNEFLTTEGVALIAQVPTRAVDIARRSNRLKAVQISKRKFRFKMEDVRAWLDTSNTAEAAR
jgi:hypothetical protein